MPVDPVAEIGTRALRPVSLDALKTSKRLAVLALAAAAFVTACEQQPAVTEQPVSGTVQSADGARIAYNAVGSGDTALVFVHGWSCDSSYWKTQLPAFAKDYRVVTVDLAGHGASAVDRKDRSIPAFGEDVAAVIRALPNQRVILVGHSLGGPVVLEAARRLPGRVIGVVGVDTFTDLGGQPFDPAIIAKFKADLRRDPAGTTRNFVSARFFQKNADPKLKQRIVDDMASAPPAVAVASMEALLAYDPKPAVAALKSPITAINSDLEPPMNEAAARKIASQFRMVTINGTGHFLHMEMPDQFNSTLRAELGRMTQ